MPGIVPHTLCAATQQPIQSSQQQDDVWPTAALILQMRKLRHGEIDRPHFVKDDTASRELGLNLGPSDFTLWEEEGGASNLGKMRQWEDSLNRIQVRRSDQTAEDSALGMLRSITAGTGRNHSLP